MWASVFTRTSGNLSQAHHALRSGPCMAYMGRSSSLVQPELEAGPAHLHGQEPKDKGIEGRVTPSLCLLIKRSVSVNNGEVRLSLRWSIKGTARPQFPVVLCCSLLIAPSLLTLSLLMREIRVNKCLVWLYVLSQLPRCHLSSPTVWWCVMRKWLEGVCCSPGHLGWCLVLWVPHLPRTLESSSCFQPGVVEPWRFNPYCW